MSCTIPCDGGYIPLRKSEDIPDLKNPFIFIGGKKPCNKCSRKYKNVQQKKDELFIILLFILFLLLAKLLYFS